MEALKGLCCLAQDLAAGTHSHDGELNILGTVKMTCMSIDRSLSASLCKPALHLHHTLCPARGNPAHVCGIVERICVQL
jgi:hypothetical protein